MAFAPFPHWGEYHSRANTIRPYKPHYIGNCYKYSSFHCNEVQRMAFAQPIGRMPFAPTIKLYLINLKSAVFVETLYGVSLAEISEISHNIATYHNPGFFTKPGLFLSINYLAAIGFL
jgi:hypothetical protein